MGKPFVGRQSELERLAAHIERAQRGRATTAALVTGVPGSGKSRLLREVVDRAVPRRHVRVVGFEPTQAIPLGAAADLVRSLRQVPGHGQRLEQLVFGDPESTAVPGSDPLRIYESIHRAVAAAGPVVVTVDDLQWVDDVTIGLLLYLLRADLTAGVGLCVIAAARRSPRAASLETAVQTLLAPDDRSTIDLSPLSMADGRVLVQALDQGLDDTAAADVWRRAEGSPFWLEALALGHGRLEVGSLISDRLRALGVDAAMLVATLAVGGRPVDREQAAKVLDWEPTRLAAAVRELAARGIVVESGTELAMAHDLIREAATAEVPASLRRSFHARFAVQIEQSAGDDLALLRQALEHRAAAGLPATDLALRIVASSRRRLLGREGLLALAAVADSLPAGGHEQLELDERLGEIAAALGEQDLAIARWSRVAQHAPTAGQMRRALLEAGWAAYHRQDDATAGALAERARAAGLEGSGHSGTQDPAWLEDLVRLETLEADRALWLQHRTAAGAVAASHALGDARRLVDLAGGLGHLASAARATYLAALVAAMDAALQEDRSDDVVALGEESLRVAVSAEPEAYVAALNRVAFALDPLGRIAEAERRYREAWDLAERLVLPAASVEAGHGLAAVLNQLGRLREAREVAGATLAIEGRLTNAPRRWGHAAARLHAIELSLGHPREALEALRLDAAHEPDPHFRLGVHETIARWEARTGGPAAADVVEAELAAARADGETVGCPRCSAELAITSAELLARIGEAARSRRELEAWSIRVATPSLQARRWRDGAEAILLAAEGDRAAAAERLAAISDRAEADGLLIDTLWAKLDLGRVLAGSDHGRAADALREAGSLADRIGAASQARLVARELRRLGVRAWRRGTTAGESTLSAREAEVARLVAAGASNREVSEALLIAPKTVERHVSNALTKLGLRNRTELAGLMRERERAGADPVRVSPDDRRFARA